MIGVRRITPFSWICFFLSALCFWQGAAQAAAEEPNYAHGPSIRGLLHWQNFPLHIFFPPSRLATRDRRGLVLAGFDEWVRATGGVACYQIVSTEAQADLVVTFTSHTLSSGGSHVGGVTTLTCAGTVLTKSAMEVVEKDDDPDGFQAICAHEFGHVLGIDGHSDDPDDMMAAIMTYTLFSVRNDEIVLPTPARTVTPRDLNTLRAAYPASMFPPQKH